jgi:hypothetical protein
MRVGDSRRPVMWAMIWLAVVLSLEYGGDRQVGWSRRGLGT